MGPLTGIAIGQAVIGTAANVAGGIMAHKYSRDKIRDLVSKRYSTTEEGEYLRQVSREGLLSDAQEAAVQSSVSRATARSAQDAISQYRAAIASRGMEGSIAANRGVADIGMAAAEQGQEAMTQIQLGEASARQQALSQYASNATRYNEAKDAEISRLKYEGNMALVTGIVGAAESGLLGAENAINVDLGEKEQKELVDLRDKYDKLIEEETDPNEIARLKAIRAIILSGGYNG